MSSGYRLAPPLAARLVGLLLVLLAVAVLAGTLLVALLGGPPVLLLAIGLVAVAVVVAIAVRLRRVRVLELDDDGYRVRMVRAAGVRSARWADVQDAVAASPSGVDCLVLRLRDGRTTTIPVAAVDARPEVLAEDLRSHLRRGEGLRPL